MLNQRAGVLGTGHSYPAGILTNADLEKMVETSDEWITTRTGIKQRRKAAPGEYTSLFAVQAAQEAIERARIDPSEIDLLICATVTPDQLLPATGCLIQAELGANKAAAFDLAAACSGFLYGLTLANTMIRTGQIRYALVIGAEDDRGVRAARIRSEGGFAEHLYAPGGGTRMGTTAETIATGQHYYKMK